GEASEPLTPLEGELLGYLWRAAERVVTREELLREVWGYHPTVVSRAVDHTVRRVRQKIEPDEDEPVYLRTVHGQGYLPRGGIAAAPAPPPPVERPTNLGAEPSPFIGRADALAALDAAFATSRLVTVVGPAGAGKTRLARE